MGRKQAKNNNNLISVLFVCKLCGSSNSKVDDFLQHKKSKHFKEFQNIKCIIFDERVQQDPNLLNAAESQNRTKKRKQLINDDADTNFLDCEVQHLNSISTATGSNFPPLSLTDLNEANSSDPVPLLPIEIKQEPDFELHFESIQVPNNTSDETELQSSPPISTLNSTTNIGNTSINSDYFDPLANVKCEFEDFAESGLIPGSTRFAFDEPGQCSSELTKTEYILGDDEPGLITCDLGNTEGDLPFSLTGASSSSSTSKSKKANKNRLLLQKFTFPSIQIEKEITNDLLPLADWLRKQKETPDNNIILFDPDPTEENQITSFVITPEDPITCKLCCKKLESLPEAKVHGKYCYIHNKQLHRFCVPCNKLFNKPNLLRQHTLNAHGTAEAKAQRKKFKCPLCPKEFLSINSLKNHEESHKSKSERVRPFMCPICGYRFLRREYLNDHLSLHSEESPFKCPHPGCTMAFKMKAGFRYHLKTHDDSRPFKCPHEDCDKAFRDPKGVREHLICHSDDRPFKCEIPTCGKSFSWKKSMERHARLVHSDDRPFKCMKEGCEATFKLKERLVKHYRQNKDHDPRPKKS